VTLNPITINVCTILCILDLILTTLCLSNPRARLWRPKISGYVEDVVQQFDAFDVQRMFRLSWPAVDMLIKVVSSAVQKLQTVHARGKPAVSTEKKVLMFLYYMGSQPLITILHTDLGCLTQQFFTVSTRFASFCMKI